MSLLRVAGVQMHFDGVRAVDGVSFELHAGEFAALIGPNGAGKSTLFGVIAGQHRADAGSVQFDGVSVGGLSPERLAMRGIGRTFQSAQAFASMTLRENVQLASAARAGRSLDAFGRLQSLYADEAAALLARVGLQQQAQRAAADVAYSDLKRLELAIALAGRPRLLLMDEPTAGMAPAERRALMDLVRDLASRDAITVLFTEHSMDVVFGYARRILVLSRGKLIADGTPEDVRQDRAAQAAYFGEEPSVTQG
jgi:ABC-type branched-subunit amino acid transport system ATPase component